MSTTASPAASVLSFSGSKPVGATPLNWASPSLPSFLTEGDVFDIWTDEYGLTMENEAHCCLDEAGLFIKWKSPGRDAGVIDCLQALDVRAGTAPKDKATAWDLELRCQGSVEYRTIAIVMAPYDMVNVGCTNMAAKDEATAKKWITGLRVAIHRQKLWHLSPRDQLFRQWRKTCLTQDANGSVLAKNVIRLLGTSIVPGFTSAILEILGVADDSSPIPGPLEERLPFEKYYDLYIRLFPRPEIESLFASLVGRDYHRNAVIAACDSPRSCPGSPSPKSRTNAQGLPNSPKVSSHGAAISPSSVMALSADKLARFINDFQRDPRSNELLDPPLTAARAQKLIATYEPSEALRNSGRLSYQGFVQFLLSYESAPYAAEKLEPSTDMNQPIAHYFISSSHNTYLVGRQFGGKSCVEMYRHCLLSGCRSVEIDCWDGSNGEPIVTHGKAMCTDISYRDVLLAIRDTAFVTSSFPVILSYENHCSRSQQLKLAEYAIDIFGDYLLKRPLPGYPLEPGRPLPSPNDLRYKILIKNKRLRIEVERRQLELYEKGLLTSTLGTSGNDDDFNNTLQGTVSVSSSNAIDTGTLPSVSDGGTDTATMLDEASSVLLDLDNNVASPTSGQDSVLDISSRPSTAEIRESTTGSQRESLGKLSSGGSGVASGGLSAAMGLASIAGSLIRQASAAATAVGAPSVATAAVPSRKNALTAEEVAIFSGYRYEGATTNVHPLLSSMVNYTEPIRFQGFEQAASRNLSFQMSSFNENAGLALVNKHPVNFVNYNKRQLSRVYPRGGRYDSSNFNPQLFWNCGCQMAALNFQTSDAAMQLNQGRFELNGRCGYLLKPEIMRQGDRIFDPIDAFSPLDGVIAVTCSVLVLSAQFVSLDRQLNTFVEVDMLGLNADTIRKEFQSRIAGPGGLSHLYAEPNEEPAVFVFRKVIMPELACLRFGLIDADSGRLIGQRILPLDGLQPGYRHIALRTEGSTPIPNTMLFCRITLDTFIPMDVEAFVSSLADPLAASQYSGGSADPLLRVKAASSNASILSSASNAAANQQLYLGQFSPQLGRPDAQGKNLRREYSDPSSQTLQPTAQQLQAATVEKIELLTAESKSFKKLLQRQQQQFQKLKKRHATEKMELANKHSKSGSVGSTPMLEGHGLMSAQAMEFATLYQRHFRDERDLKTSQAEERYAQVKVILESAHNEAIRDLATKHEREAKDQELQQARQSKESKDQVQDDKTSTISRQERERRIRELKESNIKRFCEERKRLANGHERQRNQLQRDHQILLEIVATKHADELRSIEIEFREEESLALTRPQVIV